MLKNVACDINNRVNLKGLITKLGLLFLKSLVVSLIFHLFFRKTMEKTVGLGNRMDLVFHNIRLGLFYMDHSKLHVVKPKIVLNTVTI